MMVQEWALLAVVANRAAVIGSSCNSGSSIRTLCVRGGDQRRDGEGEALEIDSVRQRFTSHGSGSEQSLRRPLVG